MVISSLSSPCDANARNAYACGKWISMSGILPQGCLATFLILLIVIKSFPYRRPNLCAVYPPILMTQIILLFRRILYVQYAMYPRLPMQSSDPSFWSVIYFSEVVPRSVKMLEQRAHHPSSSSTILRDPNRETWFLIAQIT